MRWAGEHEKSDKSLKLPWRRGEKGNRLTKLARLARSTGGPVETGNPKCLVAPFHPTVFLSLNAWLRAYRAGKDRSIWVNSGLGIYKMGVIAGQKDEEAGFSR